MLNIVMGMLDGAVHSAVNLLQLNNAGIRYSINVCVLQAVMAMTY